MNSPTWPHPEFSIGVPCSPLGRFGLYKCWSVRDQSPAHEVWKKLSQTIIDLLKDIFEHLEGGGLDLKIDMFMIGRKPKQCVPTILFTCESTVCRRRCMEVVEKKGLLADYPGVKMGGSSFLPSPLASEQDSNATFLGPNVGLAGDLRAYGVHVSVFLFQQATIGGFVCIDKIPFAMSTSHCFFGEVVGKGKDKEDFEFSFFGGDPFDSFNKTTERSEDITSQGNIIALIPSLFCTSIFTKPSFNSKSAHR